MKAWAASLLLWAAVAAHAQPCPAPADLQPAQLVGLWRAQLDGERGATLLLRPHPRYAGSLTGEINRDGERAQLAADLDQGEFTLEESADGVHIAATWLGDVAEGSCGKEIRGMRQAGEGAPERAFILRRVAD